MPDTTAPITQRVYRWARLRHHALAESQARRILATATGEDFDLVRARLFELAHCPDPMTCACLDAKPLRKLVQG